MVKQNIENLETEVLRKTARRDKKKKVKMKVSGSNVKKLQKIIKGKAK